ncbi:MAG: hypothetical protein HUU20_10090 [Pirellulales bacterium]|nr:hypothetical protein [Pirellulales bacterium]
MNMNMDQKGNDPSHASGKDVRRLLFFWFLLLAVGARIAFWAMTDRIWEDSLITVRHAENAARGLGLTHHPGHGQPVHGFTSPVSVLIPLLGELIVPGSGIDVVRVSSLLAAALTIWLGYRIAVHPAVDLSPIATAFFLGYLALEFHQILYGMAGMETQWIVAITLFGLWQCLQRRSVGLGIACGLALWGRPDGIILILAIFVSLVWQRRWRALAIVFLVAALTFAPWVLFTEIYYGSVVPHTVVAKKTGLLRLFQDQPTWAAWAECWAAEIARRANFLRLWFSPVYGGTGCVAVNFIRGARPLQVVYFLLVCVGLWRTLRRDDARVIGVFGAGFAAYVLFVLPYPFYWYLMPWLGVVALLFALGIDRIRGEGRRPLRKYAAGALAVGYLALYAFALTRTFPAERHIQIGIENACRVPLGRWLDEHVAPNDWVACECLGYFGWYSNRAILDFPGLCSPRSVAALRQVPEGERSLAALVDRERPEWLALRPSELKHLRQKYPGAASLYVEAARFQADPERVKKLGQCVWLDGFDLTIDEEFIVLRRRDVPITTDAFTSFLECYSRLR